MRTSAAPKLRSDRVHQPLSKQEAAERIGISLRTLSRMMRDRRDGDETACPPWAKVRRRVLFDIADVETWQKDRKHIHDPLPCQVR